MFAHAVDDLVELWCRLRIFDHPAVESKCHGIEQPPRIPVVQVGKRGMLPLRHDVRHPLDVDNPLPVKVEYHVIRLLVGQHGLPVAIERAVLLLPVDRQGFDQFPNDAGKVAFAARQSR